MNNKKYIPYDKSEKIRIVFMFQTAEHWASIESVYKACLNDKRLQVLILLVDKSPLASDRIEGALNFLNRNNLPYKVYSEDVISEFKPHIAVYLPPYDMTFRYPNALSYHLRKMGVRIVYIPYGIEIADTEDARTAHFETYVVRNSWRLYTFSEMMKDEYLKYCRNRHSVRVCGLPKFDYDHKAFKIHDNIKKQAMGRKIILWKIHFPKVIYHNNKKIQVTPDLNEYKKFVDYISVHQECFFIFMPHPWLFSILSDNKLKSKAMEFIEKLKGCNNVYIDTAFDYRNSLYNADAIIVDRSAIMVESGFCNVPVLYMSNKAYDEPLTKPVKMLVDTYEKGYTAEDMENFVDNFMQCKAIVPESRYEVINNIYSLCDGNSGERIKNDIIEGLCEAEYPRKKIVLFGVGNVGQYFVNYMKSFDEEYEIVALSDNNSSQWGQSMMGIDIVKPEDLVKIKYDYLIITTEQFHLQIKKQLVYDLYLEDENILRMDEFCEEMLYK